MNERIVTITGKEKAELLPLEPPPTLGADQVFGQTICSLISPGTEISGTYAVDFGKDYPKYTGYASVIKVEKVGSDVKDVAVGDVVFCMGCHCTFAQVPANSTVPVPLGLRPEKAVLARLMGVSMTTLMTTYARPGDRVMITGAGPVGFLASKIFEIGGYEVLLVEPNAARRKQIEQTGMKVLDSIPINNPEIAGSIAMVVECSGHEQAAIDACKVVRKRGEVVMVGVPWKRQTEILAHELLSLVFHKYVVLRTGWEWELPRQSSEFTPHSIASGLKTAVKWLKEDRFSVEGLIELVDPNNPQPVYQDLLQRRLKALFNVFDWTKVTR
jgi:threonine dehydrogenase-like Zn-dependent dehydrogenase